MIRRDASTSSKINAMLAIAFLLVVAMGAFALLSTATLVRSAQDVERTHRIIALLETVNNRLLDAETAQRGFVITGDTAYLRPHAAAIDRVASDFEELRASLTDVAQRAQLDTLEQRAAARLAHIDSVLALRAELGPGPASAAIQTGRGRELMDEIRARIDLLEAAEEDVLAQRIARSDRAAARTRAVVAAGSAFAGILVLIAGIVLNHDLRRRRRMEAAVRESETLLNQFLESLPAGAFVIAADGTGRYANRHARVLLGLDASGSGAGDPPPYRSRMYRAGSDEPYPQAELPLARALRGETVQIDDIAVDVDGARVPLRVAAVPIYDSHGDVAYAIAVFSDISLERRHRLVLRAARDAAEQANRAKSEFLTRMSHELRTPLNSVIGFANIVRRNGSSTLAPQDLTYLERIAENGKHLLAMINDILDLAKVEAGRVELEITPVELRPLIEETLLQWEPALKDAALSIRSDVPDGVQPIAADRGRLKQVLTNLVGNAIKFTPHGTIDVSVELLPGTNTASAIHVTDTGIGIPAHRQDAVFAAFEQADTSTSRTHGGTGLGLPISRSLCQLMGFGLGVQSAPGKGSRFTIALDPTASVRAVSTAEPLPLVEPGADCLVLVVDDDADTRILLTHHLEEAGCRVVATPSGRSALQLARELHPDMITVDLLMEDVTGWEVLSQLKSDPRARHIPVVVISVIAEENRAALLGTIDILAKPVRRDVLIAAIRRNAARQSPRVLIVEDDAALRTLMGRFLEVDGIPSTTAANGLEALHQLENGVPDLIVLDINMPVLGGVEFLHRIRVDPRFVGLPVVIVTGEELEPADIAGLTGAAAVLDKGVELQNRLRETVRMVLQRRGTAA